MLIPIPLATSNYSCIWKTKIRIFFGNFCKIWFYPTWKEVHNCYWLKGSAGIWQLLSQLNEKRLTVISLSNKKSQSTKSTSSSFSEIISIWSIGVLSDPINSRMWSLKPRQIKPTPLFVPKVFNGKRTSLNRDNLANNRQLPCSLPLNAVRASQANNILEETLIMPDKERERAIWLITEIVFFKKMYNWRENNNRGARVGKIYICLFALICCCSTTVREPADKIVGRIVGPASSWSVGLLVLWLSDILWRIGIVWDASSYNVITVASTD